MKRLPTLLVVIGFVIATLSGCATVKANKPVVESLAEKAGMVTATFFNQPQYVVAINTACIIHTAVNKDTDPELAQKYLTENVAKLWDDAYDQGMWVVTGVLNDLVRFMKLQTSDPTKESVDLWVSCMNEFCRGVDEVRNAQSKKEASVHHFLKDDLISQERDFVNLGKIDLAQMDCLMRLSNGSHGSDGRANIGICALTDSGRQNLAGCD